MSTETKRGTIDNPVKITIPAAHWTDSASPLPHLVIDLDLTSLGVGGRWVFDGVLHVEDGTITVMCYPDDDDEGWERLNEVGEW